MIKKKILYRLSHWIVELVTLANAACGLIAGFFLVKFVAVRSVSVAPPLGYLTLVWLFIFFGGIFDYLDGVASRRLRVSTELGKELDSQCDGVTFGVMPAMIILFLNVLGVPLYWHIFAWISAIAYMSCALFRLARFDVTTLPGEEHHLKFRGMPTPTAAGMVGAVLVLYIGLHDGSIILVKMLWEVFSQRAVIQFSDYLIMTLPFLGLLLAYFMVSDLEYIHWPIAVNFCKTRKLPVQMACVVILILLVFFAREMVLIFLPLPFFLYGPINHLRVLFGRAKRS